MSRTGAAARPGSRKVPPGGRQGRQARPDIAPASPTGARVDQDGTPRAAGEPMAHAINWLRDEIVSGRIMPGERLIEADLAQVLGTNRANVRIALYVLETEGLVSREPNRGARVRPIPE